MRFLSFARITAGLAGILTILAACTVVVDEPGPLPPSPGGICTREYAPVCGQRGGDRQTFGNSCVARSEGYRVIYGGACRRDEPRPEVCTREYRPVCGERRGQRQTFGNACVARAEGFRVIREGQCRGDAIGNDDFPPQACTREYAPVCARRGRDVRTFPNACEARVADYQVVDRGPC